MTTNQVTVVSVPTVLKGEFPQGVGEWVNEQFGSIHTLVIKEDIWFIGKEIAEVLKYEKPSNAIHRHVDKIDRVTFTKNTLKEMASNKDNPVLGLLAFSNNPMGGVQRLTLINESGLYSLIMGSKLKSAIKFQRWVTREVLPSIRKHGAYITPEKLDTISNNPDEMKKLVDELKSDAEYTRQVLKSDEALPITLIAKEYGMTAQQFHSLLNKHKILFRKGKRWHPYKSHANLGWFINQTYKYEDKSSKIHTSTTLYVTQLGRRELEKVLINKGVKRIA